MAPTEDSRDLLLRDQVCFRLYAASRLVSQAYRPLLDELGLTYPQYLTMMVLWEFDGATVAEIADRLQLSSGTLTPVLKRLADHGLIARRRNPRDERTVENRLTAEGRALKRRAVAVPERLLCAVNIHPDELGPLVVELDRLLERLRAAAAVAPGQA